MTVSEAPMTAPAANHLVRQGPGVGALAMGFAALLGTDHMGAGGGSLDVDASGAPMKITPQGRRQSKRESAPPDDPKQHDSSVNDRLNATGPAGAIASVGVPLGSMSKLTGMALPDTAAQQGNSAPTIQRPITPARITLEPDLEMSTFESPAYRASEDARQGTGEAVQPTAFELGSPPRESSSDGELAWNSNQAGVDSESHISAYPAQPSWPPVSGSTSADVSMGSDAELRKTRLLTVRIDPQMCRAEGAVLLPTSPMTQQASLEDDGKRLASSKGNTVATGGAETIPTPLANSVVRGSAHAEDRTSLAGAVTDSPGRTSAFANRDLFHGSSSSSPQSRSPARSATESQPTGFADLTQLGTGHPLFGQPAQTARLDSEGSSSASTTQAVLQQLADVSGRELQKALHSDLRVGVPTQVFGHVTIEMRSISGQLSAQLSLEDSRESVALARHLPAVEQTLMQHFGVDASIKLAIGRDATSGTWGGDFGGSSDKDPSQGGRRNQRSGRSIVAVRSSSDTPGLTEDSIPISQPDSDPPLVRLSLTI